MSLEQLKAFLSKAKGDSNLQNKLKAAKSTEDVVGIAKEHGHEFTVEKIAELSEEELESLAGGTLPWRTALTGPYGNCANCACPPFMDELPG